MAKLTIVFRRAYEFTGSNGELVSGFQYGAFDEKGKGISFTSKKEHEFVKATGFDPNQAVEIELDTNWDERRGKIKYREATEKDDIDLDN